MEDETSNQALKEFHDALEDEFTLESNMKTSRNELGHTGKEYRKKQFSCSKCDKKFRQAMYLKIHERIHTDEKPFTCSKFDKKFAYANVLKNHERIHNGEKPFSCSKCYKSFSRAASLKTHERIHTVEKP